jgi:hypothetical protein
VKSNKIKKINEGPKYILKIENLQGSDQHFSIWQVPSSSTPQIKKPKRIAGLHGRNLALFESRLIRILQSENIDSTERPLDSKRGFPLSEDTSLKLGLIFRMLAPMRKRENMSACIQGIEVMNKEEAAYWLGMAMHRKNPRRVLMALRFLLTDPKRK